MMICRVSRRKLGFSNNKTKQTIPDSLENVFQWFQCLLACHTFRSQRLRYAPPAARLWLLEHDGWVSTSQRNYLAHSKEQPQIYPLKILWQNLRVPWDILEIVNNCHFGIVLDIKFRYLTAISVNIDNPTALPKALRPICSSLDTYWARRTNP